MGRVVGVIGGSGLESLAKGSRFTSGTDDLAEFQYYLSIVSGVDIVFVPRHGDNHQNLPLDVPYADIFQVFDEHNVDCILAFSATGTLDEKIKLCDKKSFVVPSDYIRGFGFKPLTAHVEGHPHADVSEPFNNSMRSVILDAGRDLGYKMTDGGIYVMCEGNQFESKAEIALINAFLSLGRQMNFPGSQHLYRRGAQVGMTAVKEVILSAEYKIPYALVACPVNLAAGMSDKKLSHEDDTLKVIKKSKPFIKNLAFSVIERLKDLEF